MKELGYDLSSHTSKILKEIPDTEFDYAVTMGCGDECPLVRSKSREDWNIPDPKALPPGKFPEIRDLIEQTVKELISRFL